MLTPVSAHVTPPPTTHTGGDAPPTHKRAHVPAPSSARPSDPPPPTRPSSLQRSLLLGVSRADTPKAESTTSGTNETLAALLSKPSSATLANRINDELAFWARYRTDISVLTLHQLLIDNPEVVKILDRQDDFLRNFQENERVLRAVLKCPPDVSLKDAATQDSVFNARIALLQRCERFREYLARKPASKSHDALTNKQNDLQTAWRNKIYGATSADECAAKAISLVAYGGNSIFASANPLDEGETLTDFLTLAAKNNMVILALPSDSDFKKYPGREKYFEVGLHEFGGIQWSSKDVTPDGQKKLGNAGGPRVSCYELAIQLPQSELPGKATVIRCERWPDGTTVPLEHVTHLLDELKAYDLAGTAPAVEDEVIRSTKDRTELPRTLVHCIMGKERTSVVIAMQAMREASESNGKIRTSVEEILEVLGVARDRGSNPVRDVNQLAMIVEYAEELQLPLLKTDTDSVSSSPEKSVEP